MTKTVNKIVALTVVRTRIVLWRTKVIYTAYRPCFRSFEAGNN